MLTNKQGFLVYLSGLRGLAILLVVLFHLLPLQFSQGFLGVDIFFVLIGYLLFRSYNSQEPFPFKVFINKKIIRIYPVLACTIVLACVLMAFVIESSNEIKIFDRSAKQALLGQSNIYFNKIYSDYFSDGANLNPLLHTWYLAVTLQVYLMWACACGLISLLCKKYENLAPRIRKFALWMVVSVGILSCQYSHSYTLHELFDFMGLPRS